MLPLWRLTAVTGRSLFAVCAAAGLMLGTSGYITADRASATDAGKALRGTAQSTRFVIGLDKPTEFQVFSLNNPNRVIVELPDQRMELPPPPTGAPIGLVQSFRGGLSAPGQQRVVIDVTSPVVVEKAQIERSPDGHGQRLVLDIVPMPAAPKPSLLSRMMMQAGASSLGAGGVPPPLPRPAMRPEAKAARTYKPIIVLDPGHGGHDSGAQKYGTVEKDVVLAFAKSLRDKLEKSGRYKVMMTRDDDTFIELDARRDFAEHNRAALFIAIHADYANTSASGATIYSLRDSVAEDLRRSAKGSVRDKVLSGKELPQPVKADGGDLSVVKGFLADLAQREVEATQGRTSVFAQAVIDTMRETTSMKDNPDRSAAFRVLKTAQVPAVLIELAYVTNQQDARNLKSDSWRDKVSASIMTAIDNYFNNQISRLPM